MVNTWDCKSRNAGSIPALAFTECGAAVAYGIWSAGVACSNHAIPIRAGVAQLVRVSDCDSECRGFKSRYSPLFVLL